MSMKKLSLTLFLVLILLSLNSTILMAGDVIKLDEIDFSIKPDTLTGETMVPIDRLEDELDIKVLRLFSDRFFIHRGNKHYIFKIGEREVKLRNKTGYLSKAPIEINGHILVPMEFITDVLGYRIITGGGGLTLPEQKSTEIDVSLITEKRVIKNGRLSIYFLLENRGDSRERLNFSSGKKFDILVRKKSGEIVYRWSENKRFSQALSQIEINADETVSMQADLKLYHVDDGDYFIEGYINTDEGELWAKPQQILIE